MTANVHRPFPARSAASLGAIVAGVLQFAAASSACAADSAVPLRVEFSGCAVVLQGPTCVLGESRQLRLWVGVANPSEVRVRAGRDTLVPQAAGTRGSGVLLETVVPDGVSRIDVQAGTQRWQLAVGQERQPEVFAEAVTLARAGDGNTARALVETELDSLPARWRGKALNLIGQLHRREGDVAAASQALSDSISASMGAGRQSEALKTATVLTFLLLGNGSDIAGARAVMQAQSAAPADAEGQYDLSYHRGLVAFNAGNARVALRELEAAAAVAARMDRPALKSYAESVLAVQLQRIGRHRLASELLERWAGELPAHISPCNRAHCRR